MNRARLNRGAVVGIHLRGEDILAKTIFGKNKKLKKPAGYEYLYILVRYNGYPDSPHGLGHDLLKSMSTYEDVLDWIMYGSIDAFGCVESDGDVKPPQAAQSSMPIKPDCYNYLFENGAWNIYVTIPYTNSGNYVELQTYKKYMPCMNDIDNIQSEIIHICSKVLSNKETDQRLYKCVNDSAKENMYVHIISELCTKLYDADYLGNIEHTISRKLLTGFNLHDWIINIYSDYLSFYVENINSSSTSAAAAL